ncbi:MAG: interleukin-like EMT inducer domain-containing protein [Pseudomonadota bacterium]
MNRIRWNRDAVILALLLVLGTLAYFTFQDSQGNVGGVAKLDGYYYYVYLRSMQMDGDLDFSNEYEKWGNPFQFGKTDTGRARNVFGIGPALLWTPFFILAHFLCVIGIKLGFPLSPDGLSRFHQVITFYGSLVYAWMAVIFCYYIIRRVFGKENALWATFAAALAGPLPFYCLSWASYSHAPAAMATSLLVLLYFSWHEQWNFRRWFLFGATAGLVILIRPACAPFLLIPAWAIFGFLYSTARTNGLKYSLRCIVGPLFSIAAMLLVFSPQLLVWNLFYGTPFTLPQGYSFLWWSASAWHSLLFSPRNGLLTSAPLMIFALVGLFVAIKRNRNFALCLLAVFVAILYLNGAVHDWWGWGFSARRFTSSLPIFAFGFGAILSAAKTWLAKYPLRTAAWVTSIVIIAAILFNLEWMCAFNQRNLKWYQVRSTQSLYMNVANSAVERVYDSFGNPLSLPSSLAFKLRHGGSLKTYDRIDGSYLLGEVNPETNPGGQPYLHAQMDLSSLRFRYNLSESFGNPVRNANIPYVPLREKSGHIFIPLNRPGPVQLRIRGQSAFPKTKVIFSFNEHNLNSSEFVDDQWTTFTVSVPGDLVQRGINRLDLVHELPKGWDTPPQRTVGESGVISPVDIAVASGGMSLGNFCEIWVNSRLESSNVEGANIVVIDANNGNILGGRGFDVYTHPAQFEEIKLFLEHFPKGNIVAIGVRGDASRHFAFGGKTALVKFGAQTDLTAQKNASYAAIGVLGAQPGSAIEQLNNKGHALARVGSPPPQWREIARYNAIRLE